MTLEEKINGEIKKAMLAKDQKRLAAIRAIKSEILLLKTGKGKDGITPEMEIATLQKMIKQRTESAAIYKGQGREDLEVEELTQANIIKEFLPEQMSREDVVKIVKEIVASVKEPLQVILNGLGKDAAYIISRINGFTYVQTKMDYYTGEVTVVKETAYSKGASSASGCIRCILTIFFFFFDVFWLMAALRAR